MLCAQQDHEPSLHSWRRLAQGLRYPQCLAHPSPSPRFATPANQKSTRVNASTPTTRRTTSLAARSNALCTAAFIERTDPNRVSGDPGMGGAATGANPLQMGTSKPRSVGNFCEIQVSARRTCRFASCRGTRVSAGQRRFSPLPPDSDVIWLILGLSSRVCSATTTRREEPSITSATTPQITRPPLPAAEHLLPRTDGGYSCHEVAVRLTASSPAACGGHPSRQRRHSLRVRRDDRRPG